MSVAEFVYRDTAGNVKTGELSLRDYELADRNNMRTSTLLNRKYSDADERFGSAFSQGARSLGIFPKGDPKFGIPATTIREAMTGECMEKMGAVEMAATGNTIVTPSGPKGGSTPASRVFMPEIVLDMMNEKLIEDHSVEAMAFNKMIASDQTIQSEIYTRLLVDVTVPREHDSRPIAQNSLPRNQVSISTGQTSYALRANSIGLQISEQAQGHASIDLVSIILAQQVEGERYRNLWRDMGQVVSGNVDVGEGALTPIDFKATLDTAAGVGEVTQLGWLKSLYDPTRKVNMNALMCTLDVYMDIVNRTGRPLMFDPTTSGVNHGNMGTYGLDVEPNLLNWAVGVPNVLLVPEGLWPVKTYVLLDTRYALMRVRNASASYAAVEKMVLQRTDVMRFDYSEHIHRLFPSDQDVIKVIDYSNDT